MKDKKVKLKAKVVFEWEYEAQPRFYLNKGESVEDLTIDEMIKIDGGVEDIDLLIGSCTTEPIVEITEVKEDEG